MSAMRLPDPTQLRVRAREDGDVAGAVPVCPPEAPAPSSLPEEVGDRVPAGVETLPVPVESVPVPGSSVPEAPWLGSAWELTVPAVVVSDDPALVPGLVGTETDRVAGRRDRRRTVLAVVGVLIVAVLAWGGLEVWKAREVASARDGLTAAVVSTARELDRLTSEISEARTVLERSEGHVADEATRERLAEVLDHADELAATAGQVGEPGEVYGIAGSDDTISGTVPDRPADVRRIARELTESAEDLVAVRADLAAAVEAVTKSITVQQLAAAVEAVEAARADLAAAMSEGETVLVGSEGQVADDAVRAALGAVLDAAALVRDAQVDVDDIDAVKAAAAALTAEHGKVDSAAQAVRAAQDAWTQAEADRRQAEPDPAPAQATTPAQAPQQTSPQQETPPATTPEPEPKPVPVAPATGSVTAAGSFTSCSGTVTVRLAGQTKQTTVGAGGAWSVPFSGVPFGTHTVTSTCDGLTATNTVEVK